MARFSGALSQLFFASHSPNPPNRQPPSFEYGVNVAEHVIENQHRHGRSNPPIAPQAARLSIAILRQLIDVLLIGSVNNSAAEYRRSAPIK